MGVSQFDQNPSHRRDADTSPRRRWLSFWRSITRQVLGHPFSKPSLEAEFQRSHRSSGIWVIPVYCWVAALAFATFSVTEMALYHRSFFDRIQVIRSGLIVLFLGLGFLYHGFGRTAQQFAQRHYVSLAAFTVLACAGSIDLLEFLSQVKSEPQFFLVSVTALAIEFTVFVLGFLRLTFLQSMAIATLVCAEALAFAALSDAFSVRTASRMMSYMFTAFLLGGALHRLIEHNDRRIFLRTARFKVLADLRKRVMDAEMAANATKVRFLAMLSHEIRSPMHGTLGLMRIVMADPAVSEATRKAAKSVAVQCDRLVATFSDMLDYAQLAGGSAAVWVNATPVQLDQMVHEVANLFHTRLVEKGLELTIDVGSCPTLPLMIDQPKLGRILVNLIGNAYKFTPKGTIVVFVQTDPTSERGVYDVRIGVMDTGIGIAEEHLTNVFKPFFQVDSAYSRRYEGAGLGLAVTQELVSLLNGHVEVASEVGKGTTVVVHIKLREATYDEISSAARSAVESV